MSNLMLDTQKTNRTYTLRELQRPNFQHLVLTLYPLSLGLKLTFWHVDILWSRGQPQWAAHNRDVLSCHKEEQRSSGLGFQLPTFNIEEQTDPQVACVEKPEMDKNNSMTNAGKTYKESEARHSWDSLTARSTRKGWTGKNRASGSCQAVWGPVIPKSFQAAAKTLQ